MIINIATFLLHYYWSQKPFGVWKSLSCPMSPVLFSSCRDCSEPAGNLPFCVDIDNAGRDLFGKLGIVLGASPLSRLEGSDAGSDLAKGGEGQSELLVWRASSCGGTPATHGVEDGLQLQRDAPLGQPAQVLLLQGVGDGLSVPNLPDRKGIRCRSASHAGLHLQVLRPAGR